LQDFFYPIGSVTASPGGATIAWGYFKANFEHIKGMLSKASPSLMDAVIVYTINRFCTNERAAEIETYFKENPLPSSERKISQTIENMRSNAQLLSRIRESKLTF
jgi:puromycin-sensitive aminopeptidase